jgi:cytoskeletal protein RodZ
VSNLIFYAFLILIGFVIWLSVVNFFTPEAGDPIEEDGPGVNSEGQVEETENQGETQNPPDQEQNKPIQNGKPNETEQRQEEEPSQEAEPTITRGDTEGNRTYFTYENADQFKVRLEAKEGRVWFSLNNEETNEEIEQMELQKGESKEWDLSDLREVRFKFGNTPVVRLLINGQEVDLTGLSTVHHVIISYKPGE